jgi:hypothetical protein
MNNNILDPAAAALLVQLSARGLTTSTQLQMALGKSQPTVSRLLRSLGPLVLALGQGRATRYAQPHTILGLPAQQPIYFTDADSNAGHTQRWGALSFLAGQQVHVAGSGSEWVGDKLPWFMASMRLQGFLGRAWARTPALQHLGGDPTQWSVEQQLFALLVKVHDLPGALTLGDAVLGVPQRVTAQTAQRLAQYDETSLDITATLPAASSAEGEQPKWLTIVEDAAAAEGQQCVVVKFTPPRNTPFGRRWHDLLHAEALALETLAGAGEPVAAAHTIESATRTYLESPRFDRIGFHGRRHVVALHAAHDEFVGGAFQHWAATADTLAAQRRLSAQDAERVRLWRAYGQLIANTDMHFGNLSLFVDDIASGRFTVAPCYDMLPMKYKPEPHAGDFGLQPIEPERPRTVQADIWAQARALAIVFWGRVAEHTTCSSAFRDTARENAARITALAP